MLEWNLNNEGLDVLTLLRRGRLIKPNEIFCMHRNIKELLDYSWDSREEEKFNLKNSFKQILYLNKNRRFISASLNLVNSITVDYVNIQPFLYLTFPPILLGLGL